MNARPWYAIVAITAVLAGCGSVEPEGLKLKATVSATRKAQTALNDLAKQAAMKTLAPLRQADNISFTPSRMEIYVQFIAVYNQKTLKEINIPVNKWVDVATTDELSDLANAEITINEDQLGYYDAIKLVTDTKVRIWADLTIEDTTYVVSDVELGGLGGFTMLYTDSFPIGGEAVVDSSGDTLFTADIPTIRVILDATGAAAVAGIHDNPSQDMGNYIPEDSTFSLGQNLIAIPYVGTERPQVDRYQITWENGWEHHLRLITVANSEGALQTANYRVVHSPDFRIALFEQNPGLHLVPSWWPSTVIRKNGDGSFWVGNDPEYVEDDPIDENAFIAPQLVFPSFRPEDHSGQMMYGDSLVNYTAVKLQ